MTQRIRIHCVSVVLAVGAMLPVAAVAVVPVDGATPALTPVTINADAGDQYDPHVSGDWAVFTDNFSIHYYNFVTPVDTQIPMGASARDLLSDISGSKVVFSRVFTGVRISLMVFDTMNAAAPLEIDSADGTTRLDAAIGSNTVAYIDFGLQEKGELAINDLGTLASTRITNDTEFDATPNVSPDGNVVVWEHCATSTSNCDIRQAVKGGAVWSVGIVSASADPEANPDSNGTLVVYDARRGANPDIFWRPVAGGSETQLELSGLENDPSIAGDYIAFESRPTIFDPADLYVYDMVSNALYQITDTPLITEHLSDITVFPDGRVRMVWTSDEDGFDQRNVRAVTFTVRATTSYTFGGFQQPVDPLPALNLLKAGAAVPVKFSLGGNRGLGIFAAGYPKSQTITCDSIAPEMGIEQTVTAGGNSLSYDAALDQYKYVWKTEKAWANTCRQLVMNFSDGSSARANFKFK